MTETLVLEAPPEAREVRIRRLFGELGGSMTTREFAGECINAGVWTENELSSIQIRGVQSEIRLALRKSDSAGLPFAGQTTERPDGQPVWKQRPLWLFADYELNICELVSQRDECHATALKLADECADKFGSAPDIASLEGR